MREEKLTESENTVRGSVQVSVGVEDDLDCVPAPDDQHADATRVCKSVVPGGL